MARSQNNKEELQDRKEDDTSVSSDDHDEEPKLAASSSRPAGSSKQSAAPPLIRLLLVLIHLTLWLLFTAWITALWLRQVDQEFFRPQMRLMKWPDSTRPFEEVTYYDRVCDARDSTTSSFEGLSSPRQTNPFNFLSSSFSM